MNQLDYGDAERSALERFKRRVGEIQHEVEAIDRELARRDILALAHRTRRTVRAARSLLDRNTEILFHNEQMATHEELYAELEFAEGHIAAALSVEVDFQAMEQRLFLATQLVEDVLAHVMRAADALWKGPDGGGLVTETPV